MKKNTMMRIASLVLVLTLLSTCAISGTFAKYVTTASGTDSARVAKWGVAITANGGTFAKEYAKTDNTVTVAANTVVSTENVVAPGTSGTMATMSMTGTPEVAVRVSYEATTVSFTNWAVTDDTFYCPIVITVNETEIKGLEYETADAFVAKIKEAIKGYSKDYAAGTNLATVGTDALNISWAWAFEGDNAKDTELGNLAAGGTVIGIEITVETTVTQID